MGLRLMVKNLSSRSEGEERPRDGAVDFNKPVLHREAIAELKNKIEKPVLRPGGEELAHRARGEE